MCVDVCVRAAKDTRCPYTARHRDAPSTRVSACTASSVEQVQLHNIHTFNLSRYTRGIPFDLSEITFVATSG